MTSSRTRYVAVAGPGEDARPSDIAAARAVGELLAERGWIALTGGRDAGVMAAAAEGVAARGGMCIGILPGSDRAAAAPALTASIPTAMGEARNALLITAADAVIACGLNAGTLSELAFAIRARRPMALVGMTSSAAALLTELGAGAVSVVDSPEAAIEAIAAQFEKEP